ncbi:MAG: DUF4279 domain-containing protein [Cyclobacteriaceae bacterium]|nr:DUF4279 domain-containing protein [Cyclobacteriaceae bacterium]
MKDRKNKSHRTPIDSGYESCESTYVEFLVYIDNEEASYITKVLDIVPSKSQTRGDLVENSRGLKRTAKSTYWILSSEEKVLSKDLRHHLNWLLDQLTSRQFQLSRLQNDDAVSMTVNCLWWSRGSGGPTLWPEQMRKLSALNLECTFDFYLDDS